MPLQKCDDLRTTMEAEFTKQFAALRLSQSPNGAVTSTTDASGAAIPASNGSAGAAESLAHLPPCRTHRDLGR